MKLFPRDQVVGIFRGFNQGGLEFHAEIILPYRNEFQNAPMHGQFVLIQLESEDEGVLGRITSISAEGKLTSSSGEDYGIRALADDRAIEDLRNSISSKVDIRVLGLYGTSMGAGLRTLPPPPTSCREQSCVPLGRGPEGDRRPQPRGADLGFFALGEFTYAEAIPSHAEPWMRIKHPAVVRNSPSRNLVSRRSFVFARAGFGKSNLNKLLSATSTRRHR